MRFISILIIMTVCFLKSYAQSDNDERQIVGVSQFESETNSKFNTLVTEKVVEVLTNSKRFIVVDRTGREKRLEELELQKSEDFIDSDYLAEQGKSLGAEKIIIGNIVKIPVYRVKNPDGSVRGYKASVAFQMKINDVTTGINTEATSFQGKASKECLSPESAVSMAMNSLEEELKEYFKINFPITGKLMKVLEEDNGIAQTILIKAGKTHGIKVGDKFSVESIEMLDGDVLPTKLGTVTVTSLRGDVYSDCKVDKKKEGKKILDNFNKNKEIKCKLIIEK